MGELKGARGIVALVALVIIFAGVLFSFLQLNGNVARGISPEYNRLAYLEAPNNLASWVYDLRGFDTFIETGVIYVGAVVSVLALGRGIVKVKGPREEEPVPQTSFDFKPDTVPIILKYFGLPAIMLIVSYGLLIVTGAATSGGGGFQCGVIISSAYLLGMAIYGKSNPLNLGKKFLIGLGSIGWATYGLCGLPGYLATHYWQYNVGADLWSSYPGFPGAVPEILRTVFGDPFRLALVLKEGTFYSSAGIVPIINLGEAFNVIGALGLIFLVFAYGWSDRKEGET
ncbi:MAG: hypothetical protein LUP94_02950 [Candidatus Methanomethylicus sp.]|nr:hypothetical protein [Candidatus Methanomethylicus sp.]